MKKAYGSHNFIIELAFMNFEF